MPKILRIFRILESGVSNLKLIKSDGKFFKVNSFDVINSQSIEFEFRLIHLIQVKRVKARANVANSIFPLHPTIQRRADDSSGVDYCHNYCKWSRLL